MLLGKIIDTVEVHTIPLQVPMFRLSSTQKFWDPLRVMRLSPIRESWRSPCFWRWPRLFRSVLMALMMETCDLITLVDSMALATSHATRSTFLSEFMIAYVPRKSLNCTYLYDFKFICKKKNQDSCQNDSQARNAAVKFILLNAKRTAFPNWIH